MSTSLQTGRPRVKLLNNGHIDLTSPRRYIRKRQVFSCSIVRMLTPSSSDHNAGNSRLLGLPIELRLLIWTYALRVDVVQGFEAPTFNIECDNLGYHPHGTSRFKGGGLYTKEDGGFLAAPCFSAEPKYCCATKQKSAFHLPEVCRQIYSETATLAYSINTFLLSRRGEHPEGGWAKKLTAGQRNAISSVQMNNEDLEPFLRTNREPLTEKVFPNLKRIWVTEATMRHYKTWKSFIRYNANIPRHPDEDRDLSHIEYFDLVIVPNLKKVHGNDIQIKLIRVDEVETAEAEPEAETDDDDG